MIIIFCPFLSNGAPVEWNWQGKTEVLGGGGGTCPTATLSTTNPTWTDPGSNPGLRGGRPAANRLSHGTAFECALVDGCVHTSEVTDGGDINSLQHSHKLAWNSSHCLPPICKQMRFHELDRVYNNLLIKQTIRPFCHRLCLQLQNIRTIPNTVKMNARARLCYGGLWHRTEIMRTSLL
jgi:hypothetical protein